MKTKERRCNHDRSFCFCPICLKEVIEETRKEYEYKINNLKTEISEKVKSERPEISCWAQAMKHGGREDYKLSEEEIIALIDKAFPDVCEKIEREQYKKELEQKGDIGQLAWMDFTDLLKKEHNITKIPPPFYDVLGVVLARFRSRCEKNKGELKDED